jgi:hypothetical protein
MGEAVSMTAPAFLRRKHLPNSETTRDLSESSVKNSKAIEWAG